MTSGNQLLTLAILNEEGMAEGVNANEGLLRLAAVIRGFGYLLGALLLITGFVMYTSDPDWVYILAAFILGLGAAGVGRAISWVVQGFAKPNS
jgi:hypothetical protein